MGWSGWIPNLTRKTLFMCISTTPFLLKLIVSLKFDCSDHHSISLKTDCIAFNQLFQGRMEFQCRFFSFSIDEDREIKYETRILPKSTDNFESAVGMGGFGRVYQATEVAGDPLKNLAYGAGLVNPDRAFDPGLVFHIGLEDIYSAMCEHMIDKRGCKKTMSVRDLNQPSVTLTFGDEQEITVKRMAKNVGQPHSTYS